MYGYYIASPGFNPDQVARIHQVEAMLTKMEVPYYSPFAKGNRLDANADSDMLKFNSKLIFEENINNIDKYDHMVAVVDDEDKGTYFEVGYFASRYAHCANACNELNKNLLLLGDNASDIASTIQRLLANYVVNNNYIQDLTKKNPIEYVNMGFAYGTHQRIITHSDSELDSNVMTACATFAHHVGKMFPGTDYDAIFASELFQLKPFKFFKKVD